MRFWLTIILLTPIYCWGCKYGDDVRLENNPVQLVRTLIQGEDVGRITLTLGNYLKLKEKSRQLFEEHLRIISVDCSYISVYEGEIIGQVVIPFEEFYRTMAWAIQTDRPNGAKKLMAHARAAPMSIESYMELFGRLPYERTGGLEIRQRMKTIFPLHEELPPSKSQLRDPVEQGRWEDYTMARFYKIFGGDLLNGNDCVSYQLHSRFYEEQIVNSLLGEHRIIIARPDPTRYMLALMGYNITFTDKLTYSIKGCVL